MNEDRQRRARLLFEQALERPDSERVRFVEEECGNDAELRRTVEALMASDERAGTFLEEPLVRPQSIPRPASGARSLAGPSGRLGRYELLGKIGEGGTSSVYLAETMENGRCREVAIKVGRADLDRPDAEARLRKEQAILSALVHPGIARLLDAGATAGGTPYFVMEYVDGVPIHQYCDAEILAVSDRLSLFRKVCEAVHYAHSNLVVHRDLKPSNILVDAAGEPRLLDFGIAKILAPRAGDRDPTTFTERALTPSYAAPEQLKGERITTATDVYSLGVVLYELLTGLRPHEWRGLYPHEILERWERQEPLRPSVVVRGGDESPADAEDAEERAGRRRTTPAGLARLLAGDLDNIVLRALRFEPERRYASVMALADDLRRHAEGLPVTARPATRRYRLGKFVRRHSWGVANAAAVFLLVTGFAISTSLQSVRLARERDAAERQRTQAELERERADRERAKAEAVTRFLVSSFELADPTSDEGRSITAREILDRQSRWVDSDLATQPEALATVKQALGQVYAHLGLYAEAESALEQALSLRRQLPEGDELALAETLAALASTRASRGAVESAEQAAREALRLRESIEGETSAAAGESRRQLAEIAARRGDLDAALELALEALEIHRPSGEEIDRRVARDLRTLMEIRFHRGELRAAEETGRAALEMSRRVHPTQSLWIADDTANLGAALWALSRYDEAEGMLRAALEMHRSRLGADHPQVASDLSNLGSLELEVGHFAEAEALFREALEVTSRRLGDRHPAVARLWTNLGVGLLARDRLEEAEPWFRRALGVYTELYGESHPRVAENLHHLGTVAFLRGDYADAEPLLRRALGLREELHGGEGLPLGETEMMVARVLHRSDRLEEAGSHYRRARAIFVESGGPDHWLVALARLRLVELATGQGVRDGLLEEAREAIQSMSERLSEEHWRVAEGRSILGALLVALGRHDEARRELDTAYERLLAERGPQALATRDAARRLAELDEAARRIVQAGPTPDQPILWR